MLKGILGVERDSQDSHFVAAGILKVAREDYRCNLPQGFSLSLGVLAAVRDSRFRLKDSRNRRDSHTTYKVHNTSRIVVELPWANRTVRVWWNMLVGNNE